MSNVLADDKHQQILGLGRLGWTLRRIEEATGVRRETVSAHLKAAGIAVRSRGRPGNGPPKPAISGEVSTDPGPEAVPPKPGRAPTASACEPYREVIVDALNRGRNAVAIWQDLVTDHGFTARYASVRRFILKLRGSTPTEARVVITTAPGEDYGKSRVMFWATSKRRSALMWRWSSGMDVRIIAYSDSSQAKRSFGSLPRFGIAQVGVPARVSASRFMSRSIWM